MSSLPKLKQTSGGQTGTKPKSKLARLTTSRFSPKKQQSVPSTSALEVLPNSLPVTSSPKRSPRHNSSNNNFQEGKEASKSVTFEQDLLSGEEMGLVYGPMSMFINHEEPVISFLEFESLYNLEKELTQSRKDPIAELDEKCILGSWFGTRQGVYTELPDPCRNVEWLKSQTSQKDKFDAPPSQVPSEGFSFAPGWAINAEHFYQWQQRGKSIQQVHYRSSVCVSVPIFWMLLR